jgi:hypothetical protein
VGDAVLAADAVEQHLGRVRAEPAGEHLAVVREDLVGDPVALQGGDKTRQTLRALARSTSPAAPQNREWSSRPVRTLSSRPSASQTPPITSSCHNSIGRSRSHRRQAALRRRRATGSINCWRTSAR